MWSLIILVEKILLFLSPDCLGEDLTLEGKNVRLLFFYITLVPRFFQKIRVMFLMTECLDD